MPSKKEKKKKLILPDFKNEDQERDFWDKFDLSEYASPGDFEYPVFPNLKPTTTPISLRMPGTMLWQVKEQANKIGVPYQAIIKQYIAAGLKQAYK